MQVNFFATFRSIAGKKTVYFDLADGISVSDFLNALVEGLPALKKHLLGEDGQLLAHVHVIVNGHDVMLEPQTMQTALHREDKIDIFPPIAGG
jgi:molybdopterin synthase sulfur carrier subunit